MWASHVGWCVTDFSSLIALLEYLVTYKIRAQLLSPDGKYQTIFNFFKICHKSLDCAYLTFDWCAVARSYQQTHFIVPAESAGAHRVLIVPEHSGSHRHRATALVLHLQMSCWDLAAKWGPRITHGTAVTTSTPIQAEVPHPGCEICIPHDSYITEA